MRGYKEFRMTHEMIKTLKDSQVRRRVPLVPPRPALPVHPFKEQTKAR